MKRPQHKKNKHSNPADETPVIDERNLVGAEESAEMSIEDRVMMYWIENKAFAIGCFVFLVAFISVINGFRIYKGYAEDSLQAAYSEAKAKATLDSFAKEHSDKDIGGFAALTVADEAFNAEEYPRAIEFYQIASAGLEGNILAGRAALGEAFAEFQSGQEEQALTSLGGIAANGTFAENIRAEAAYHLAVNAFIAGNTEAFESYVAQVDGFERAQQWNQRLQYYVQQSR